MEHSKKIARCFFEKLGFHVDDIPETDAKRADLDVNDGEQQYIIEVKEKLDTGSQLKELLHPYGKIMSEPHATSNRLDGVIKYARKQLQKTPANSDAIRLIFLFFAGPNANMFVRRSLYTFYGVQDIIPVSGNGDGLNCIYFHNSFAFNSPNIDGLILMENNDLQLCLNEFSNNHKLIRKSKLVKKIEPAVYNPVNFEDDDRKLVLRSDISRTDENVVLNELERITGVCYNTLTLNRYHREWQ